MGDPVSVSNCTGSLLEMLHPGTTDAFMIFTEPTLVDVSVSAQGFADH